MKKSMNRPVLGRWEASTGEGKAHSSEFGQHVARDAKGKLSSPRKLGGSSTSSGWRVVRQGAHRPALAHTFLRHLNYGLSQVPSLDFLATRMPSLDPSGERRCLFHALLVQLADNCMIEGSRSLPLIDRRACRWGGRPESPPSVASRSWSGDLTGPDRSRSMARNRHPGEAGPAPKDAFR
jgi:hypothetical protein